MLSPKILIGTIDIFFWCSFGELTSSRCEQRSLRGAEGALERNRDKLRWGQQRTRKAIRLGYILQLELSKQQKNKIKQFFKFNRNKTLAGVAQWIEYRPASAASWIPSQSTCPGCGPGLQKGVLEKQLHIDVSLTLSPFLPLSLKINKIF